MAEKKYDVIVYGASGFTGQFIVEEFGRQKKENGKLKYAIAGRSKPKLQTVLETAKINTGLDFSDIDILVSDVEDKESLIAVAKQGKLLLNCVGPFRFYGVKVVEACIEARTDYTDISGEPQFLEQVQLLFDEKAKEKGVHIVGSCGFDSVPADMGTIFLQDNFNGDVNSVDMIVGYHDSSKGNAAINVTTLECALHGYVNRKELGKIRKEIFKEKLPKSPYKQQPKGTLWWSEEAARWCLPNLASDRSVVMRTQHLNYRLGNRRPIQFNAYFGMQTLWSAIGAIVFGLVFTIMAPFKFTRNLFLKYPSFFSFGSFSKEGAKREELKDLKFLITLIGSGWDKSLESSDQQHTEAPNVQKIAEVMGPDPGYFGTADIAVQCALTMVEDKDKLPEKGGVFTPGSAFLHTNLIERLQMKGIKFQMVTK